MVSAPYTQFSSPLYRPGAKCTLKVGLDDSAEAIIEESVNTVKSFLSAASLMATCRVVTELAIIKTSPF